MAEFRIDNAVASNLDNALKDFNVDSKITDGTTGSGEHTYLNTDWERDYGYYDEIPELKTAINTKANWTIGAGFEADETTKMLLDTIKGNGKDSFNGIIKNAIKVKTLSKDSFAEIILDGEDTLINIKPLDPSSIKIVQSSKGIIVRYEQISKVNPKKVIHKFKPEEIFHLSRERMADEIHGSSLINSVKWIIDARNEAMGDFRKVLHRYVKPQIKFALDTDDPSEIAVFKTKQDKANADGENMYIPKGAVEAEILAVAGNATLNPLTWINQLNDYFFQAVNVPQIIIGNAKEFTDASGKIVYLSYEQSVKAEQLYVEEQCLNQLGVEIKLTFPASLQTDAVSDTTSEVEEEAQEPAAQPNDTNTEIEGQT